MLTHELLLHDVMVSVRSAVIVTVITGSIFFMTVTEH
jgi:hypothetical protein